MKDTIIVDLDGTLANIEHRTHLIRCDKPDWRSFYRSCVSDTPNEWCVSLVQSLCSYGFKVLIVSARSKEVEFETNAWLAKCLGSNDRVKWDLHILREVGDYTPDHILKKRWLSSYGKDNILFAIDDRKRIVDMWRSEGLICLQCAEWEEYRRPPKNQVPPTKKEAPDLSGASMPAD